MLQGKNNLMTEVGRNAQLEGEYPASVIIQHGTVLLSETKLFSGCFILFYAHYGFFSLFELF